RLRSRQRQQRAADHDQRFGRSADGSTRRHGAGHCSGQQRHDRSRRELDRILFIGCAPVTYTAPAHIPAADLNVIVTARAGRAPSVQVTETLTVPALAISVDPSGANVAAGTTTQFTASANYPAAVSAGIAWKAQCGVSDCGTVSPASSASGAPVIYTAPAGPVPTDLAVTLTANSVSAPSVQVSATITVGAITVGVTPISALIPLNATQPF